ncbi:uncharacterized protein LOC131664302 [Phymastichus coffea]|uniref:uncharacterized protein LOC131664302 n=1 Tax=Phymastichus coffea TaxID=108790 RepID=UPI00273CB090|nr:uncharacterized protein LOC131664302 [Phymastichus coffea]
MEYQAYFASYVFHLLEPAGYRLSSSYLPPSSRYGGPSPSSTYLPASSSSSRLQNTYSASQNNYQHQSSYRRSQSSYQAPSYQSSQDYNSVSASTYLPPSNRNQSFSALPSRYVPAPPKDTYFLPEVVKAQNFNALSTSYGVPEYNDAHLRDYHHHNHEVS